MTTQTIIRKIDKEVSTLRKDVEVVKGMLLAAYRDPEGEYKKGFVKKMLARAKARPKYRFTTREEFLRHVYGGKK